MKLLAVAESTLHRAIYDCSLPDLPALMRLAPRLEAAEAHFFIEKNLVPARPSTA
jgi:hypothetical protein